MTTLEEFKYHEVNKDTTRKMSYLRKLYYDLAYFISTTLPECRSKSLCLTELEQSSMRAIQALAISEGQPIEPGN